ncbi:MAG: DUF3991 and toprim domain-containing protein [Lachnospiraceae bacterium]|nr:DUF3991 and toprim domain-containing protein [Lachnospiraceae bacterium]
MPMPFSEDEMKKIFSAPLADIAREMGFTLEDYDRKTFHVKGMGGLYIYKPEHGRGWYQFTTGKKGNIIGFVMEFGNKPKREAMESILKSKAFSHCAQALPNPPAPKKPFELPPKADSYKQMIAYLIGFRRISKEIVYHCIKNGLVYQARKILPDGNAVYNCAFVGKDKGNVARHCHLTSANSYSAFRGDVEGSDQSCGFSLAGASGKLYVFESAIDALSGASLIRELEGAKWSDSHYLGMNGAAKIDSLKRYLEDHPEIGEVFICLDNDEGGIRNSEIAKNCLLEKGLEVTLVFPTFKDMNEDLAGGINPFKRTGQAGGNFLPIIDEELDLGM